MEIGFFGQILSFLCNKGSVYALYNPHVLNGIKVIIFPLNQSNVKSYMSTYKSASAFSKVYVMMPDFWEKPRQCIEDYIAGETNNKARYLIVEKALSQGIGYIELDYSNAEMPEVDIAILENYRAKGYAFEAAKILFANLFEDESIKCIIWNAFRSNKASCRIAEKLGGVVVNGRNLIMDAMLAAGCKIDSVDSDRIPEMITYEINRAVNW